MKKYVNFLVALSSACANFSYAAPALICPATITCSTSADWILPHCKNLPEGWDLGITAVDRKIVHNKEYVLHFTGANFDADEFANCIYNQIGPKSTVLNVAIRSFEVRPKKDPSMAWQTIPIEPFQAYTEYCFSLEQYSTIVRNPAACLFEPFESHLTM